MKIIYILFSLCFFVTACSSLEKVEFITPEPKEIFTTIINDEIEVSYNEDGKFLNIKITISEKVKIELPGARDRASSRALSKAKLTLSNYIDNSDKRVYLEPILQTLKVLKNIETQNIAKVVSDDMRKRKEYILDSLYLDRVTYFRESKIVNVIARSSTTFDKVSKKLKEILK